MPLNDLQTEIPESAPLENERSFTRRWKHEELFDAGFVAVPSAFLQLYAHLKPHRLSLGEAMFVLHLMAFKWGADDPFPGYATLAERMGVSIKMVRRHAQSLQAKQYLRREIRTGRTNRFDLTPLFDALHKAFQEERRHLTQSRRARTDFAQQMVNWTNRMMETYRNMSTRDRQALSDWEAKNLNGNTVGTSDWPGWEKLIGRKPQP
jgi:DNA-binding MarR family transcriptional regulator